MANLEEMKADQQANTNALAKVKDHPILGKTTFLEKRKDLLGSGLPGHMLVDREIRTATVMLMQSRDLQRATPESFYTAVSIAVNSGIGLGSGKGYLVAYNGNVSYLPGWKGLVDLVSRTGRASVWTGVVHKGDHFEYELGDSPFLKHKPGENEEHKDITHYYAVGRVKNSEYPIIEVWTVAKVIKHLNKYNKVGGKHYALKDDNNFEMYGRKVVLLQALKYLPQSQDLENAIAAEVGHESGRGATIEGNFVYVNDEDVDQPVEQEEETIPRTDNAKAEEVKVHDAKPTADKKIDTNYDSILNQLENAADLDKLAEAADLIKTVEDQNFREKLSVIYKLRMLELTQSPGVSKKEAATPEPARRARRASTAAPE